MDVELYVKEEQPYSMVLDVPRTLEAVRITKVGLDALLESTGWFCAARDGSSDIYYKLGDEPYEYMRLGEMRTEGALVRRLEAEFGQFKAA